MRTFALLAIADPAALPPGRVAALGQPETRDGAIRVADPPLPGVVSTELKIAEGDRVGAEERLDRERALRALTLEAARAIRMEAEIGSSEVGKRADFTVLDDDPLEVPVEELADLGIWGTVFEGRIFPIER